MDKDKTLHEGKHGVKNICQIQKFKFSPVFYFFSFWTVFRSTVFHVVALITVPTKQLMFAYTGIVQFTHSTVVSPLVWNFFANLKGTILPDMVYEGIKKGLR